MADKPVVSLDLSVMDRLWIRKSLELQRTSIVRSRGKEMEGSPILALRDAEVAQLNALLARLG